jgi:hypothetical protein
MALGTDWANAVEALSNRPSKPPATIANALTLAIDLALNIFPPFLRCEAGEQRVREGASLVRVEEAERRRAGEEAVVHPTPT